MQSRPGGLYHAACITLPATISQFAAPGIPVHERDGGKARAGYLLPAIAHTMGFIAAGRPWCATKWVEIPGLRVMFVW
ncbi:MAG: hypothetical protein ACK4ZN_07520 [Oceanibaculum sp.]